MKLSKGLLSVLKEQGWDIVCVFDYKDDKQLEDVVKQCNIEHPTQYSKYLGNNIIGIKTDDYKFLFRSFYEKYVNERNQEYHLFQIYYMKGHVSAISRVFDLRYNLFDDNECTAILFYQSGPDIKIPRQDIIRHSYLNLVFSKPNFKLEAFKVGSLIAVKVVSRSDITENDLYDIINGWLQKRNFRSNEHWFNKPLFVMHRKERSKYNILPVLNNQLVLNPYLGVSFNTNFRTHRFYRNSDIIEFLFNPINVSETIEEKEEKPDTGLDEKFNKLKNSVNSLHLLGIIKNTDKSEMISKLDVLNRTIKEI